MNVYEELYLPVEELPPEGDWTLYSGNNTHNAWRRPSRVLVAMAELMDWVRTHAPLTGPDGASAVLMRAAEALDAATLDAMGEPPATDLCVVCRGSAEWRATVTCGRLVCPYKEG